MRYGLVILVTETHRWLIGIIVLLCMSWGGYVMKRLADHDADIEDLGKRLTKAEKERAHAEVEAAKALGRVEGKVDQMLELVRRERG